MIVGLALVILSLIGHYVPGLAFLAGGDRYERVMEGWVDNTHDTAFTHTVEFRDPSASVRVSPRTAHFEDEYAARYR